MKTRCEECTQQLRNACAAAVIVFDAPFHGFVSRGLTYTADHKGVAPAIIAVGWHDFLYQVSLSYVAKLREAGVRLIYREYPTLNHGS